MQQRFVTKETHAKTAYRIARLLLSFGVNLQIFAAPALVHYASNSLVKNPRSARVSGTGAGLVMAAPPWRKLAAVSEMG